MSEFFDKIYGCLIGGAIGDAMGAPAEDWHYTDIRPLLDASKPSTHSLPDRAMVRLAR